MQLVGRRDEVRQFEWNLRKNESQFVAVYGRRRIGKTYLVRELFNDTFAFSHTGLRGGGMTAPLAARLASRRFRRTSAGRRHTRRCRAATLRESGRSAF